MAECLPRILKIGERTVLEFKTEQGPLCIDSKLVCGVCQITSELGRSVVIIGTGLERIVTLHEYEEVMKSWQEATGAPPCSPKSTNKT